MMDMLTVVAQAGCRCPYQHATREKITDTMPVQVPDNRHYRRLLRDGSLRLIVDRSRQPEPAQTKDKTTSKKGGIK